MTIGKRLGTGLAMLAGVLWLSGCFSLSEEEKRQLAECIAEGMVPAPVKLFVLEKAHFVPVAEALPAGSEFALPPECAGWYGLPGGDYAVSPRFELSVAPDGSGTLAYLGGVWEVRCFRIGDEIFAGVRLSAFPSGGGIRAGWLRLEGDEGETVLVLGMAKQGRGWALYRLDGEDADGTLRLQAPSVERLPALCAGPDGVAPARVPADADWSALRADEGWDWAFFNGRGVGLVRLDR